MNNTGTAVNSAEETKYGGSFSSGLIKTMLCTAAGIFVFFVPLNIPGHEGSILFSTILNVLIDSLGVSWLYFLCVVMVLNSAGFFYGKYLAKENSFLYKYFARDKTVHGIIYLVGAIYTVMFAAGVGPEWIIGPNTGGVVIEAIVMQTAWILILGGMFVPLLLNFGGIDFFGSLLQPFMRPVFKVPGQSAIDATASFVSSSSIAVYITSKLYKSNVYTQREACVIATGFSAVSVGFAALSVSTVGLLPMFTTIFFSAFAIAFLVTIFMARIPPLSRKPDVYYDGTVQTEEERKSDTRFNLGLFKLGLDRAVFKANEAGSIGGKLIAGLLDGAKLMPKVIPFLAAVGTTGLIIAEYTPLFMWLGTPLIPLLELLQIPDAARVASASLVGIAEMYLPVLVVAEHGLAEAARFFVVTLALVQIIFFSETATVMLATGIPVKVTELIILFLQRTLIAIPIVAIFMHILF
ncbi:MAG: YjiH family protein [Firmicutes bacterium]|nr:YjiH family protein [Bacillota bacterium]